MEIYELLGIGVLAFVSTLLSGYVLYYLVKKDGFLNEIIEESAFNLVKEAQTNENFQKDLYTIGGLIGSGAKGGLGITNKSGRFKWQDIAAELAAKWIENGITGSSSPSPATPTPSLPVKDRFFK
jgi:hypothetical protein